MAALGPALGDVTDHLQLVRRMARASGSDLAEAMLEGQLTSADWSQMVTNCRACISVESCRARLAQLEMTSDRANAPNYCENRASFDRLARHPA
ncbi:DUF6455 family protein [Pseudooceanicola sp.]|uniref:DUF6455 family protein n=1 Tax=Pseudooceanicola sp. TaxID=1914328 RepID=UPI0035C6EB63